MHLPFELQLPHPRPLPFEALHSTAQPGKLTKNNGMRKYNQRQLRGITLEKRGEAEERQPRHRGFQEEQKQASAPLKADQLAAAQLVPGRVYTLEALNALILS